MECELEKKVVARVSSENFKKQCYLRAQELVLSSGESKSTWTEGLRVLTIQGNAVEINQDPTWRLGREGQVLVQLSWCWKLVHWFLSNLVSLSFFSLFLTSQASEAWTWQLKLLWSLVRKRPEPWCNFYTVDAYSTEEIKSNKRQIFF